MEPVARAGEDARAVNGIEAAAFVLRHAVEAYAVAGGEGARRIESVLKANAGEKAPVRLEGEGATAAQAALGHAAAGRRTALIVSGEALFEVLPSVRAMIRHGAPVLIVVPSHGADEGDTLPARGFDDVAHLASLTVGLLVASDPGQVVDCLLAAQRAAVDRGAPWAVAFDLVSVGLALTNASVPDAGLVRRWVTRGGPSVVAKDSAAKAPPYQDLERYARETERYAFALGAAMREIERATRHRLAPVIADGVHEAEFVIVSVGASARSARQALPHLRQGGRQVGLVQVTSLRPLPAAEIVRLSWRARAVIVHEFMSEPLGTGGWLSGAVRASFADALTWHPAFAGIGRIPPVVTVLGTDVSSEQWVAIVRTVGEAADPPRVLLSAAHTSAGVAETRIEIAMGESERNEALRVVVDWLARTGVTVVAHAFEPTRARIAVARGAGVRGPGHVLLISPEGVYDRLQIEALPSGTLVVLAGDFPDRVLAETVRAGAPRGIRVATLGGQGRSVPAILAIGAVLRLSVAADRSADAALEAAAREAGLADASSVVTQVRALAEVLGTHWV